MSALPTIKELLKRAVNMNPHRNKEIEWCPGCRERDLKPDMIGAVVPWFSPKHKLVCVYVVCKSCTEAMFNAPHRLRTVIQDRIEVVLLDRYPDLQEKLDA